MVCQGEIQNYPSNGQVVLYKTFVLIKRALILEQYRLEEDGKVIDGDGTWVVTLPMNLDYITTNEFGEQVISTDPTIGIPDWITNPS